MNARARPFEPLTRILGGLALAALACLWAAPAAETATHYPPGASCLDCHAISDSKIILGTRLIKKSSKTATLKIGQTDNAIPCLFCHEARAATEILGGAPLDVRDRMKGVWDHFDATSRSKHRASETSKFAADPGTFDCLKCHDKVVSAGVVSDGQGNATVHGRDASLGTLPVADTLIGYVGTGNTITTVSLNNQVCPSCHQNPDTGSDVIIGGLTAKRRHKFANNVTHDRITTLEKFAWCTQCHGTHNSYDNDSLIVLRDDGTAFNLNTTYSSPPVTPEKCGECHDADDRPAIGTSGMSDWSQRGHGKPTSYVGNSGVPARTMGLGCSSCHDASVPHDFFKATEDRRFSQPAVPGLSGMPTGKSKIGICTACHADFAAHQGQAGCLDCHEPHGQELTVMGTSGPIGSYNIMMVRRFVPLTSTASVDPIEFFRSGIYDSVTSTSTYYYWPDTNRDGVADVNGFSGARGPSSRGVCDNYECHGSIMKGTQVGTINIWPVNYYMTTLYGNEHGNRSAGKQPPGSNCQGCHSHSITKPGGGFGGSPGRHTGPSPPLPPSLPPSLPPPPPPPPPPPNHAADRDPYVDNVNGVGVHKAHVDLYGTGKCNYCHYGNNHNQANWSANFGTILPRQFVDVAFDPLMNPTVGSFAPAYIASTWTCLNLRCHNPDSGSVTLVGVGVTGKTDTITTNNPAWLTSFTAITVCRGCHANSPANNPDGGAHSKHDLRGYLCRTCHSSLDAATNNYSADHANGVMNRPIAISLDLTIQSLPAGGAFDPATTQCTNTYCHGSTLTQDGGSDTAPIWGRAAAPIVTRSGGGCGTCHDVGFSDSTTTTSLTQGHHGTHLTTSFGPRLLATLTTTNDITACDNCHPVYNLTSNMHHVDGAADFANLGTLAGVITTLGGTNTCDNCHSVDASTAKIQANWNDKAFRLSCLGCHGYTGTTAYSLRIVTTGGVYAPSKAQFWSVTGHGTVTTFNATQHRQPGPGYACTVCHDATSLHISTTLNDTDRLAAVASDGFAYTNTTSEVCLDCHKVGQTTQGVLGQDAKAEASVHSGGVTGKYATAASAPVAFPAYGDSANYTANPGYQCADCHDAHGSAKLAMILGTIDGRLGSISNPVAIGTAFNSTATSLVGLDITTNANDGVCDACHRSFGTSTPHPDSLHNGNHNAGGTGDSCMKCHDHGNGFVGSCTGCHGNTTVGNWWPDGSAEHGGARPNRPGAHATHIDAIYNSNAVALAGVTTVQKKNQTCNWCHPNPGTVRAGSGEVSHDDAAEPADVYNDFRAATPISTTVNYKTILGTTQLVIGTYNNSLAGGGKTCGNVDCHYRRNTPVNGGASPDGWFEPSAVITCAGCHFDDTTYVVGTTGALPAAHNQHVADVAAGGKNYACSYCHPSVLSTYTNSHQSGRVNVVLSGTLGSNSLSGTYVVGTSTVVTTTDVKYYSGTSGSTNFGSCNNLYCHIRTTSPIWSAVIVTTGCLNCHLKNQTGAPNPSSGLHFGSTAPVVSGKWHDDMITTVGGPITTAGGPGCAFCHESLKPQTTHVDGVFQGGAGQTVQMGLATFYVQSADGVGACYGTGGVLGTTGCHDGAGDQGNWRRRWDQAIHYTPVTTGTYTACAGCHGGFGTNDWTFAQGSHNPGDNQVEHGYDWDGDTVPEVIGNHSNANNVTRCNICHVYADAPFTSYGFGTLGYHGDNQIEMNARAGYFALGTSGVSTFTFGCATNCHYDAVGNTGHQMEASAWPVRLVTGPAFSCNACHGLPTGEWWPTTTSGGFYPNRDGKHQKHIDAIYAINSGTLGTTGATVIDKKNQTCGWCHPNVGTSDHDKDTAGSLPFTADLFRDGINTSNGLYRSISSIANLIQSTNMYDPVSKSCNLVDCHYRKPSPTVGTTPNAGWLNAGSVSTCSACHADDVNYVVATGAPGYLPNAHAQHAADYAVGGKNYTCTACHPSAGYGFAHQSGFVNIAVVGTLGLTSYASTYQITTNVVTLTTVKYGIGGYGTCNNLYCHIQTASPVWNVAIPTTGCVQCHIRNQTSAPNPSSGLHFGSTAPSISRRWHDDTLATTTGGCAYCHEAVKIQTTHVNGGFDGGAGQTVQMGLATFYTQTANDVGSCYGGGTATTACHGGPGEQGTWRRRWDQSIHYVTTGDVACAGCHGGLNGNDWTFGLGTHNATDGNVEHAFTWSGLWTTSQVVGPHSGNTSSADKCSVCHTYPNSPYVTSWASGYHGNDQIEMSASQGYMRVGTGTTPNFGCASTCHSSNVGHGMENSNWPLRLTTGSALACNTCHGAPTGEYWPQVNTTPDTSYPNRAGDHQQHIDAIAAAAGTTSLVFKNGTCLYCHPGSPYPIGTHDLDTAGSQPWTADLYQDGINTTFAGVYRNILGTNNLINTFAMYVPATKTCANVDCHYRKTSPSTGAFPQVGWLNPADQVGCGSCHFDDLNYVAGAAGALPGAHTQHVADTGLGKNYACNACHPSQAYTMSHQRNSVNMLVTGNLGAQPFSATYWSLGTTPTQVTTTSVKYLTTTAGTCNNLYCHIRTTSPPWNTVIVTTSCLECHIKGITTAGTPNPSSGLHYGLSTPVISGRWHDDTITSLGGPVTTLGGGPGCAFCHQTIKNQTTHADGSFQAGLGLTTTMGLATFYTQSAAGVGSCYGAGGFGTTTGCHDGPGEQGNWRRKWDRSIHYTPVTTNDYTACSGCHGGFGTTFDWTFGSGPHDAADGNVEHGYPWATGVGTGKVIGNHTGITLQTRCNTCHVYPDPIYTTWQWGTNTWHGDNQISLNAAMGYTQIATATGSTPGYGCMTNCHLINTGHNLEASGWTVRVTTGPGACTGCHGIGSTGQWWPAAIATDIGAYPNRAGDHQLHIDAIGTAKGWSTVLQKNASCDYCHPNPGQGSHHTNTPGSLPTTADLYQDGVNTTGTYRSILGSTNGVTVANMYDPAAKACTNTDCHYRSPTPAAAGGWLNPAANPAACSTCHGYLATGSFKGAALPNAHMQHVGTAAGQKAYDCAYCHPITSYTMGHQSGRVNVIVTGALGSSSLGFVQYSIGTTITTTGVKFGALTTYGTCNNLYCHIRTFSPPWNTTISPPAGCTACHIKGIATTGTRNPASGLHFGTNAPVVSGQWHDDTLAPASGCGVCHVTLTNQGTHVDGNFQAGFGTTLVANMGLASFYTQVGTAVGSCSGAGVGAAGCHDGAGDQGSWARKWDRSIHYTPVTTSNHGACAGCHGGFGTTFDWTFGSGAHNGGDNNVEHGFTWSGLWTSSQIIGNHTGLTNDSRCSACHIYNDAPYTTFTFGTTQLHGNGLIDLNGSMGYTRTAIIATISAPAFGCTATCHVDNTNHGLEGSGWALRLTTGPGACSGCHGDGATGSWWPNAATTDASGYPNRAGEHQQHIDAIGARNGWAQVTEKNRSCNFCHPNPGSAGHMYDTTGSLGTTADLYQDGVNTTGVYRKIDGAQNSITMVNMYAGATKICANVDCHYRTPSPAAPGVYPAVGWNNPAGSTSTCTTCHSYITTPGTYTVVGIGLPNAHNQHVGTALSQRNYACTYCHPNWTSGLTTTAHQSNQVNVVVAGNLNTTAFSAIYRYGTLGAAMTTTAVKYGLGTVGNCANLYCHVKGTSPSWAEIILTGPAGGCTQCHQTLQTSGNNPSSGLHYGATPPAVTGKWHDDGIATSSSKCSFCHLALAIQPSHVNGTFEAGFGMTTYMGLGSFYTQTANDVGSCYGAGGALGTTGCHDGVGDQGTWRRKWDRAISYAPVTSSDYTACAGCHGGFGTTYDWTFGSGAHNAADGSVEHGYPWATGIGSGKVIGNHTGNTLRTKCNACHVYPDAPFTTYTWAFGTVTNGLHGDNQITLNGSMGYTRTAITTTPAFGCTENCHTINTGHNLESSGWPLQLTTGPGACTGCHGNGSTGQAWPAVGTSDSSGYPNRAGRHQEHVDAIGSANGWVTADAKNNACDFCHPNPGSGGHYNNTPGSLDTTADLYQDGVIITGTYRNIIGSGNSVTAANMYSPATKACTNTDCHYRSPTPSGTGGWLSTTDTLNCAGCHGYGSPGFYIGPILTNAHMQHVGIATGQKNYGCSYCHPSAGYTLAHQSGRVNMALSGTLGSATISGTYFLTTTLTTTNVKYGAGTTNYGTCNNLYCHIQTASPAWSATITTAGGGACTQCHVKGVITTNTPNPSSGLHYGPTPPTVTGRFHDDGIATATSKCGYCHLGVQPRATHVDGFFQSGLGTANLAAMTLATFYTQTADGVGSCQGGTLGSTGCHDGAGDAGSWARKWDRNISYVPVTTGNYTACAGCHGGFGTTYDWTFGSGAHNTADGSVEHGFPWYLGTGASDVLGNHKDLANLSRCNICHVYADAPYGLTSGAYWLTTYHGNNQIEMNQTMGYTRLATTATPAYGCATNCHADNTSHNLENSGWALDPVTGPALGCNACHGSGAGEWWPMVATSALTKYPNRAGEHQQHIDAISNRMGWTLVTSKNQSCNFCHPDSVTGTPTGIGTYLLGVHNLNAGAGAYASAADLYADGVNTNTYRNIISSTNGVTTLNMYSPTTKSCVNVDCHYRNPTPVVGAALDVGWLAITSNTSTCTTCHPYVGSTGSGIAGPGTLPVAHMQHIGTAAGQKNYQCSYCHPNWTTGLYTTAHQSNAVNLVLGGTLGTGTALSGSYFLGTTLTTTSVKFGLGTAPQYGTCNNLYCHIQTTSPNWTGVIGSAGTGACTQCHIKGIVTTGVANNPNSGLHYGPTAPPVSGRSHDDGIATSTSKCGYCHLSVQGLPSHVDGMFQVGSGNIAQMSLATFYSQTAGGVGYCSGGTLGSSGCHDGVGDAGKWRRRWDRTISYVVPTAGNFAACAGCHGGFGNNDWTFALGSHNGADNQVEHNYPWSGLWGTSQVIGNHSGSAPETRCDSCHAYAYPQGVYTTWAFGTSQLHGNGQIEMNVSAGYTRTDVLVTNNTTAYGCTVACHIGTGNVAHSLERSAWPLHLVTGPEGGCTGCHGTSATGQWWPVMATTDLTWFPDRAGDHQLHVNAIANARGLGTTVSQKNQSCDTCHPNPGGSGHMYNTTGSIPTTADLYQDGFITTGTYKNAAGDPNTITTANMYLGTTRSCTNTDCHYRSPTPSGTGGWLSTTDVVTCSGCHGYLTTSGYVGGALPNAHMQHVGTSGNQKAYSCSYCHPSAAYGLGHESGRVNVILTGTFGATTLSGAYMQGVTTVAITTVKYGVGTYGTCNNLYCHIQTSSPAWMSTIAPTQCTACHIKGIATTNTVNPASGLHFGTNAPTVSKRMHDDTIATGTPSGGCTYCHGTLGIQTSHVNGSFNDGFGTSYVAAMGLGSFYTQLGTGVGSCSGGGVGTTGCHDGAGDQGTWQRRWDRNISYAPVTTSDFTTCAGCHGGYAVGTNDWTFGQLGTVGDGSVKHQRDWDGLNGPGVIGNHSGSASAARCESCHVYPQPIYTTLGNWAAGSTGAGYHGNNQIELNASDGYTRTAVTTGNTPAYGCVVNCHGSNTNHNLEASGWVLDLITGPAGGCNGCHGGGGAMSGQWWPAGVSTYPNRVGEHDQHIAAIAAANSWGTNTAQWNSSCNYCHPNQAGQYLMGTHNADNAPTMQADLYNDGINTLGQGNYLNILGTVNLTTGSYIGTLKACTNVDCHYRTQSPSAGAFALGTYPTIGWMNPAGNTAACFTCHPYVSTTGLGILGTGTLPMAHMQHIGTASAQKNYACNLCHPKWEASATTTAHQSNRVNLIFTGAFGSTNLTGYYLNVSTTTITTLKYGLGTVPQYGTCNNLYCHIQTTSANWATVIGTAGSGACTQCHIKGLITTNTPNPSSGLHYGLTTPTVTGRWHDDTITTTTGSRCGYCHVSLQTQATHVNGVFEAGVGTVNLTAMSLATFYSQTADNVGYCSGGALGSTGCHDGPGDAGGWARKWDRNISYTPVTTANFTACAGCHGGFGTTYDWTFGSGAHNGADNNVEHGYPWATGIGSGKVVGNHRDLNNPTRCNICHVYGDAPYGLTSGAYWLTTYHGNNQIEMNVTLGYSRIATASTPAYGCASTCHFSAQLNTGHNLESSGWPLDPIAGPALQCNACHGAGTGEWWPVQTSGGYPDRAGYHLRHINAIYALNSSALVGTTATDKKNQTCTWCHPGMGTTGHDQNTAGSAAQTADLFLDGINTPGVGNYRTIIGSTNGITTAAYISTLKACDNVDCHYRSRSPTEGAYPNIGWLGSNSNVFCQSCHGYRLGSVFAGPVLPDAHTQHVGTAATSKSYSCNRCHPNWVDLAHQDGYVNLEFASTLGTTFLSGTYVTGTSTITTVTPVKYGGLTTAAAGTCNNLYCHIRTVSPNWKQVITTPNGCTFCHIKGITTNTVNPSSGLHYGTTAPAISGRMHDDTLNAGGCYVCHVSVLQQGSHVDGNFQAGFGMTTNMGLASFYVQTANGVGSCSGAGVGAAGCHDGAGDQGSWARKWDASISYAVFTGGNYTSCAGCHGGFGTTYDWTFGSGAHNATDNNVEHGYPWATGTGASKVIGNHQDNTLAGRCNQCHSYPDPAYTTLGTWAAGVTTGAGFHGNNQIEMNASSGYTRQGTTTPVTPAYGCTGNCHTINTGHNLENSGWLLNLITGPAGGCDACHGFPPIGTGQTPVSRTGAPRERAQDYANGGGVHRVHVNFLWRKLDPSYDPSNVGQTPASTDAGVLCGPCHGDTPGTAPWHRSVGTATILQTEIDLRIRSISGYSWGTGARYNGSGGGSVDMSSFTPVTSTNKAGLGNNLQECSNLDCHGRPNPTRQANVGGTQNQTTENDRAHMGVATSAESLRWTDTVNRTTHGAAAKYQVTMRTVTCKWCHDETPARIEVRDAAGSGVLYVNTTVPDAATAYFRPLSGYSRGGHGDGNINPTDDPSFPSYQPATGSTPMDCSACHDDSRNPDTTPAVGHFGTTPTNLHRLTTLTIENNTHGGLCNSCHDATIYPNDHHPSYYTTTHGAPRDVIVTGSTQPVLTAVPGGGATWGTTAAGFWGQNAYGALNFAGNPDRFLNWWAGNYGTAAVDPPPAPVWYGDPAANNAAKAILPLEQYVGGGASTNRVMCVTCHNPHGTDLMTYDVTTGGSDVRQIPDNNMLRLRDTDSTLCDACH